MYIYKERVVVDNKASHLGDIYMQSSHDHVLSKVHANGGDSRSHAEPDDGGQ